MEITLVLLCFVSVQTDACTSSNSSSMPSPAAVVLSSAEIQHRPSRPQCSLHPRGLIDGLTRFFTPTDRRGPRVCRELVMPQPTPDHRKQHKRLSKTSSPADGRDVVTAVSPQSSSSPLSPSVVLPDLHSETAANRIPSPANDAAELDTMSCNSLSSLPLSVKEDPSLSPSVAERLKPSTSRRVLTSCATTSMKRSREQLTDGLSHFFTAVGKRRRCSMPKQILCSTARMLAMKRVDGSTRNKFQSHIHSLVSKSRVNCRFSPNKRVATVKLKRLPTKFTWELQRADDNSSAEKTAEICGKVVSLLNIISDLKQYWFSCF